MSDYNLLIDGKMIPGDLTMPVLNPATEEVLAQCPRASKDQLDKAVAAAKAAFPAWAATPIEQRRALVVKMAEAIEANTSELARLLTAEQGKPLAAAAGRGRWHAGFLLSRYFADLEIAAGGASRTTRRLRRGGAPPDRRRRRHHPWNFPLLLASSCRRRCLPATRWSLKPVAVHAPATLMLGEILNEVLPTGVLNVVSGGDELGDVDDHASRRPRRSASPARSATGKHVMPRAAPDLKRVTLELGGNDPAILLDDVDPTSRRRSSSRAPSTTAARSARPSSASTSTRPSMTTSSTPWPPGSPRPMVGDGMDPESELGRSRTRRSTSG